MGLFIKRVSVLFFVPLLILIAVYLLTDPYKTLKPFSLTYFSNTNRDYLSSELFVYNYSEQQYNSYIFGSSRGCGINTYHWLVFLPDGAHQYLFQAWSETITGIDQKLTYINDHHYPIDNALVLIDIPGSFSNPQLPHQAISIKDPRFSKQPKWLYQVILFYDFIQKPSEWWFAIRNKLNHKLPEVGFDPISNDWVANNKEKDISCPPKKDSLNNLSRKAKAAFLQDYVNNPTISLPESVSIINEHVLGVMNHIKSIFEGNDTEFKIIVTPGYGYKYPAISDSDLRLLQTTFGEDNVYDFSGRMDITLDPNNFSDPNHFGQNIGWQILEEVYRLGKN